MEYEFFRLGSPSPRSAGVAGAGAVIVGSAQAIARTARQALIVCIVDLTEMDAGGATARATDRMSARQRFLLPPLRESVGRASSEAQSVSPASSRPISSAHE